MIFEKTNIIDLEVVVCLVKKKLISIIIFLISIIILIFVYNDDFLYSKQIVKITKIDTISEETSQNSLGLEEKYP